MQRPKLGLALGGGVARGWAHIGVIRELQRAGIEPDIVAGTSIGAVVGGCHLAGKLDALEDWARSLNKFRIVSYMDFRVRKPGLIGGERLARLLAAQLGDGDVQDLPRRFASIATDLSTGHEVWITEGRLVDAIRASFALPGIFPPIQRGGRWLVDGSLVNPIPISVCLALGAHMVIAVNLNGDIMGKARAPGASYPTVAGFDMLEVLDQTNQGWSGSLNGMVKRVFRRERDTPSLFGVMISSLNIVLDRVTRSRLAGEPPDVHIAPKLGRIGIAEFDRAAEMIAIGEEAARDALPDIVDAMSVFGIAGGVPGPGLSDGDGEESQEGERAS